MSRRRTGIAGILNFRLSWAVLTLLAAVSLPGVERQSGSLDPEFTRLPFDEWAKQGKQTPIHWTVKVFPPELSAHQRLAVRVEISIDGRELDRRRLGKGHLTGLVQFEDSAHRLWQSHASLNLEDMRTSVAKSNVTIVHFAFVQPGDYTLSLAVCDTATLEHNFVTRKLQVAPLKADPLPNSWADLPAVEFIHASGDAANILYLPSVRSRLNLPVTTKAPLHVQVIVNMTPSERSSGSLTVTRRNLSLLIPALKVFSSVRLTEGSMDAVLVDLKERRVAWEQKNIRDLDWRGMRRALTRQEPGKIDVHALQDRSMSQQFFFDDIRRRMGKPGVVIILSGPAFFPGQDAVETGGVPQDPNARLIYIRDRSVPPLGRGRGNQLAMPADDMERALRPLYPRIYDSISAQQFRRILADVLRQLSQT
ncbi:MAG: hypothetical protein ABJC09_06685 [Terriglobia bacterium]